MTRAVDVAGRGVRVNGRSVGVGSAIPDSVVAQYAPTAASTTGDITSIPNQLGSSYGLSGSGSVLSSGINSQQTYRFSSSESMTHSEAIASSTPFALVAVVQPQATDQNAAFFDGGSDLEFAIYDNGNGDFTAYYNGNSTPISASKDTNPHLWTLEVTSDSKFRVERDGTEVASATSISSFDWTGFQLGRRYNDPSNSIEADFGNIEKLVGHTSSELQSVQGRLKSEWGTP